MVRKVWSIFCVVAISALMALPVFAQDDEVVRNPDGKVGSASVDINTGWVRNTAAWRESGKFRNDFGQQSGPTRDDNRVVWLAKSAWPINEFVSFLTHFDGTNELGRLTHSWMVGARIFTKAIGPGVAMNPDGAVGSIQFDIVGGYHRLDEYNGGRLDGSLTWPLKPMISWWGAGSWNRTQWDASGIGSLNDLSLTSGFNIYTMILTYDDENANPDGPLGSTNIVVYGGYQRRGDDNGGIVGGQLEFPMLTWLTPYISYELRKIDDILTVGPEYVDPNNIVRGLIQHEENSLINTVRIGLKIY